MQMNEKAKEEIIRPSLCFIRRCSDLKKVIYKPRQGLLLETKQTIIFTFSFQSLQSWETNVCLLFKLLGLWGFLIVAPANQHKQKTLNITFILWALLILII